MSMSRLDTLRVEPASAATVGRILRRIRVDLINEAAIADRFGQLERLEELAAEVGDCAEHLIERYPDGRKP